MAIQRDPSETNEQVIARHEAADAIKNLFDVCNRNKAMIAGFVWGTDPFIFINFRNCPESGSALAALFLKLCEHAEAKESAGNIVRLLIRQGDR